MDAPRRLALKVGLFTTTAIAIAFVIVVVLGGEGMFLRPKVRFRTAFPDVAGLQEGAFVRLGGRNVGLVTDIRFDARTRDPARALVVTFTVRREHAHMVRVDSRAQIATQGLLGDKLLDLTIGSPEEAPVAPGGWIAGDPPADAGRLIAVATEAATHARDTLARLDRASAGLDDAAVLGDLRASAASLRRIVERVERGPGFAHEVLYGEALTAELGRALRSGGGAAGGGASASREVGRVFGALRTTAPAPELLVDAARAAGALAEAGEALDPAALRQATRDLAAVTAEVRAGRGTLGGLVMDPTLYEETKQLVVNVRRNRLLRSLARWAIRRGRTPAPEGAPRIVEILPRPAPAAGQVEPAGERRRAGDGRRAPLARPRRESKEPRRTRVE